MQIPGILTIIFSLLTFSSLSEAKSEHDTLSISSSQLDAALAGTMLSAILLLLLIIVSFFTFLWWTAWEVKGRFSYIFVSSSFFHISIFLILSGMVLISNDYLLNDLQSLDVWSSADVVSYKASYVLYFIDAGIYLVVFIATVCLKSRLQEGRSTAPSISTELCMTIDDEHGQSAPINSIEHGASLGGDGRGGASTYEGRLGRVTPPTSYADSVNASQRRTSGAWGY